VLIGVALGYAAPQLAISLKPFGDAFIDAIKLMFAPIVFVTVVRRHRHDGRFPSSRLRRSQGDHQFRNRIHACAHCRVGGQKCVAGRGRHKCRSEDVRRRLLAGYVNQARSLTITDLLLNIIPTTFVDPFMKGEVLQILFVAVLSRLALCQIGERAKPLVGMRDQVAKALFGMVRVVMYFAPIGTGAAIAFTVGKFGVKTLIDLGQFVFAVFAVCLGFIVVAFGFLQRLCGFRLSRVFGSRRKF
jgi:aerobic C4-dicarboxylate transport protein